MSGFSIPRPTKPKAGPGATGLMLGLPAPPPAAPAPAAAQTTVPTVAQMGQPPAQAPTAPLHQQSFLSLVDQRNALPRNDPQHAVLGPAEHRAFAREWTKEQPLIAAPALLASIPAYTGAKALGLTKARSPASLNEMAEAYRGMWEGIATLPPFRRTR